MHTARILSTLDLETIDAGTGDDTIVNVGNGNSIDAGSGNDLITNSYGDGVSINAGAGDDTIIASYGSDVSISMGAGNDLLIYDSGTNMIFDFTSDDIISIGSNTIEDSVQSGSDFIFSFGSSDSITLKNTDLDNISIVGNMITFINNIDLDDDNTIIADGSNISISSGSITAVHSYGSDYVIDGGAGSDVIYLRNSTADLIAYTADNDSIYGFGSGDSVKIDSRYQIIASVKSGRDVIVSLTSGSQEFSAITFKNTSESNIVISNDEDMNLITYGSNYVPPVDPADTVKGVDVADTLVAAVGSLNIVTHTINRPVDGKTIKTIQNFRGDDIKFLAYDNDGNMYFSSVRSAQSRGKIQARGSTVVFDSSSDDTQSRTFTFDSKAFIEGWNVSLGTGDDQLNIATAGDYNGGNSADYFHITESLASDVTITGGTGKTGNIFYATAGIVITEADQSTIYITDSNYDIGDVLLIDAGVENLTKDFFGEGKFYNFAHAIQSTIDGVYARNVFDASDLLEDLGMDFSMIKIANRSDVGLTSRNYVGSSTNLIWVNDYSTDIDFKQTGNILLFADTNDDGDMISLSGNYNDTIHVGNSDIVNPGGGDNLLIGWDSSNLLILDNEPNNVSMSGSNLIISTSSSNNTITAVDSTIEVVIDTDDARYVAKFADTLNANISAESNNYYLFGGSNDNVLTGGRSATTLWGNGGNDTLIGGTGVDVFKFTANDDNVTITNGLSNDTISIDFGFSDVSNYEFTDTGLVVAIGDSSLNVVGSDLTTFNFSNGTHIADFSNKTL